ncbi:MAG TPA: ABC transporter permease [Verrucomicrobiae bacterium]|jgi:putative ABC transport system permease protein
MSKNHITFYAEARESFLMAMSALAAHKLRSALTLLGVLIGVFSIIVVMTAIRAMQSNVAKQLSSLGSQTFKISKWPGTYFGVSSGDYEKYWRRKSITLEQGKSFQDKTTLPLNIGMETRFWSGEITTRYKSSAPNVRLYGETPGSLPAHNWNLAEGRPLLDADVDSARDVCVLGAGLAANLFPNSTPVGDQIKIDGIDYAVIGVLESQGSSLGGDQDNFAVIPLTTGLNRYGRRSLSILVEARDTASYQDTLEEARGAMRAIRKVPPGQDDDFELASNDSMIAQFDSFTRDVRIGAALISSIALLAAGVGIMNIMLVSVTERTREIGIRRAIGAKKRNVMVQFIIEAIVLCEVGGVMGVVFGILGGDGLAALLKYPPVIPFDWVVIGLVTCSVVGVIFGTYPAYKAANLDPIESLRYE